MAEDGDGEGGVLKKKKKREKGSEGGGAATATPNTHQCRLVTLIIFNILYY